MKIRLLVLKLLVRYKHMDLTIYAIVSYKAWNVFSPISFVLRVCKIEGLCNCVLIHTLSWVLFYCYVISLMFVRRI